MAASAAFQPFHSRLSKLFLQIMSLRLYCRILRDSFSSTAKALRQREAGEEKHGDCCLVINWRSRTGAYPLMGLASLMRSGSLLFLVSGSNTQGTAAMMLIAPKTMNGKILLSTSVRRKPASFVRDLGKPMQEKQQLLGFDCLNLVLLVKLFVIVLLARPLSLSQKSTEKKGYTCQDK